MSVLSRAIERQDWELAAYCLLVAAAELAERVPPETLAEMLAMLEEGGNDDRK